MKGQFVIIDLRNMDFMKNEEGIINYYDTMDEACLICGMYEMEDAWVMELMYNHKEDLLCPLCSSNNVDINFNHYNYCRDCNHDWAK